MDRTAKVFGHNVARSCTVVFRYILFSLCRAVTDGPTASRTGVLMIRIMKYQAPVILVEGQRQHLGHCERMRIANQKIFSKTMFDGLVESYG